jgi:class 3 adenylate cyclase
LSPGYLPVSTSAFSDRRVEFRIGINMGDIVVEDGDIFGDGVNVAARHRTRGKYDGGRDAKVAAGAQGE